eukprot:7166702-Pyramimonas_sp.AAC.1
MGQCVILEPTSGHCAGWGRGAWRHVRCRDATPREQSAGDVPYSNLILPLRGGVYLPPSPGCC